MKTGTLIVNACVLMMAGSCCSGRAGEIFSQNFNADLAGITVTGETVDRTGPESGISGVSGGSSLSLKDTSTSSNPDAVVDLAVTQSDQPFILTFDFYNDALGGANATVMLRSGATAGIQLMLNKFDGSGMYNYTEALGFVLSLDQWYRVEIAASPESATSQVYSLTVKDVSGAVVYQRNDLAFRNNLSSYDQVRWYYNNVTANQGAQFYVDNIVARTGIQTLRLLVISR